MCWFRTCAVRLCIGQRANVGNGSFRSSLRFIQRYYKSGLAFPLRPVACSLPSEISGRRLAVPPLSCYSRLPPLSELPANPANTAGIGSRILTPRPRPSAPTTRLKLCPLFFRLMAHSTAGAIIISRTPHTSPSQHFQRRRVGHGVKPPLTSAAYLSCEASRPLYCPHWVTRPRPSVRRTAPLPYAVKAKVASNHKHEVWKANKTLSAAAND